MDNIKIINTMCCHVRIWASTRSIVNSESDVTEKQFMRRVWCCMTNILLLECSARTDIRDVTRWMAGDSVELPAHISVCDVMKVIYVLCFVDRVQYSGASVHELNPFLGAVREPKSSKDVHWAKVNQQLTPALILSACRCRQLACS
jgi:hypothetical protein